MHAERLQLFGGVGLDTLEGPWGGVCRLAATSLEALKGF